MRQTLIFYTIEFLECMRYTHKFRTERFTTTGTRFSNKVPSSEGIFRFEDTLRFLNYLILMLHLTQFLLRCSIFNET